MRYRALKGSFGVEARGLFEGLVPPERARAELLAQLARHQLVVVRGEKPLVDEEQIELTRLLGTPLALTGDSPLQHVHGNPFSYWHCDVVSAVQPPPQLTILTCIVSAVGAAACDTLFVRTADLTAGLRVSERRALRASRTMWRPPVLMGEDPLSGESTIFFGSRADLAPFLGQIRRAAAVDLEGDLAREEAINLKLLSRLDELASAGSSITFRMRWRPGDVLIWNNLTLCHRGGEPNGPATRANRWLRRSLVAYGGEAANFYARFGVTHRATPSGVVDVKTLESSAPAGGT